VWPLQHYLKSWLQKSNLTVELDGLFELLVSQSFYQSLDKSVQMFLLENGKLSLNEMIVKAQNYMDAHPSSDRANPSNFRKTNKDDKFVKRGSSENTKIITESSISQKTNDDNSDNTSRVIKFFKCGKLGHKPFDCISTQGRNENKGENNSDKAATCQVELVCNENAPI